MMATEDSVIWDAEFNDSVTTYWLLNGAIICVVTVIGIPFLIIWFLIGKWATRKYLASHKCTLTDKTLKVSKGILTRVEKTVPLDRITDLALIQGPIMRYFDIEALSVETAGQSTAGSMVSLAGIKDGRAFRDAVLKQRDIAVENQKRTSTAMTEQDDPFSGSEAISLLREIRDSLSRLEKK
jgi:putative membrane protein